MQKIIKRPKTIWWLGGSAVRVLDTRSKGPRFNVQPMTYQVTDNKIVKRFWSWVRLMQETR